MKKVYIQPAYEAYDIKNTKVICGSGNPNDTIPSGNGGTPPTPSNGIITTDSKAFFGFDNYEEEYEY